MGCIYKIQNKVNNKVYIGQTVKSAEQRFNQHKHNFDKPYFSQLAIYKAFKKYGIDNFTFEEIEKVPDQLLDEREKYWIQYYDSYINGYNLTLGGRSVQLYDWDISEIISLYHQYKSARKVAKIIGCDHNTIDRLLNAEGVHRYTIADQRSKAIILEKNDQKNCFASTTEAARWLIDNEFTKCKTQTYVRQYVADYAAQRRKGTYCGFKIYYESKIQSTPLATEE